MRPEASVLHLDLDAFYASVEQRDKPSLRGKPVVVGGVGSRGVVATASYEARRFGVRSAMPSHEARHRCPHAAFLSGRFEVYRQTSNEVMAVLRDLSPLVEPLSLDEAFVDLRASSTDVDFSTGGLSRLLEDLRSAVSAATGGLTASVGAASSKLVAKIASELNKPDGVTIVEPGTEVALLAPMSISVIPGIGPVTAAKLNRIGIRAIADLYRVPESELAQAIGKTHARALVELGQARDDRPIEPERETKSISTEDTFEADVVSVDTLRGVIERHSRQVSARLRAAQLFARTVTLKIKMHDFVTHTRSRTVHSGTDQAEVIAEMARSLLTSVDTTAGVRLLGVGAAGLTNIRQESLFGVEPTDVTVTPVDEPDCTPVGRAARPIQRSWPPGADVTHDDHGPGWVWGSGLGRVTVRFETRDTPPGPVRTFAIDDPALH